MEKEYQRIGVVIIGINVERYIGACIQSVMDARYPQECIEIMYVDGGSSDSSVACAKGYDKVKVIELDSVHPTPGRGRNAGWRACSAPLIQFLDADTTVDPDWFMQAVPLISGRTAAVCGMRRERYPDRNLFHMITDMEWKFETGPCRYFGGDVLVKREALLATGGFDEELIAGEDPELSYRIRHEGMQILRIDRPMTTHDINMSTLKQYMKRAYRSGYAYAEISLRFLNGHERFWLREASRIIVRTVLPPALLFQGMRSRMKWIWFTMALYGFMRPFFRLPAIKRHFGKSWKDTVLYTFHAVVVICPQFFGILRYFWARIAGRPLRNKGKNPVQA